MLRVAVWNAEGMFAQYSPSKTHAVVYRAMQTRRAQAHDAIRALTDIDADIVVIPEFGTVGKLNESTRAAINSLGYKIHEMPYDDRYQPPIMMAILSRLKVENEHSHRLGGLRNILELTVSDETQGKLRVLGIHLDDMNEANRLNQIEDLVRVVNQSRIPTLVMGDFNSMPKRSLFARFARIHWVGAMSRAIPHRLIADAIWRVHEMAHGTAIEHLLHATNLRDLDGRNRRTISGKQSAVDWMPAVRIAKLDWIFGSHHFKVTSYHVLRDVGSDHRPVVAELEF